MSTDPSSVGTNASSRGVSSQDIAAKLVSADDPLAFVRNNLKNPVPAVPPVLEPVIPPGPPAQVVPGAPLSEPLAPSFSDPGSAEFVQDLVKDAEDKIKQSVPASETSSPADPTVSPEKEPSDPQVSVTPATDELLSSVKKKDSKTNLRELGRKTGELTSQLAEKNTLLEQTKAELERYKKGEAIPDVVKEKNERIAKLEHYESLHALKVSPEYQKKFVEPELELSNKAVALAEDYGVDPTILNQAIQIDNKRELNKFLKEYFGDDVAALEVRDILDKIKAVRVEAIEAEQAPVRALETIQADFKRAEVTRETARVNNLASNSRTGWIDAMADLVESGEYPELTVKGDENHDKVAKPIIEAAAAEYSRLIELLASTGTKELPKEAAKILAKRYLISQAASVISASRAHHYERAETTVREARSASALISPQVGTRGGMPASEPKEKKAQSPEEAANQLLRKVGVRV